MISKDEKKSIENMNPYFERKKKKEYIESDQTLEWL